VTRDIHRSPPREPSVPSATPVLWCAREKRKPCTKRTTVTATLWMDARRIAAAELGLGLDDIEVELADGDGK
jgi:hypothetical protein